MIPINSIMNHIAEMAHAETFFTKHVSTRFLVLCGAFPLELTASLENAIMLPFQAGKVAIKLSFKAINICLDSQSVKNFIDKQPSLVDLFKTTFKIAGYAIGAFITLTFGVLRPYDNFRLHVAFGLVKNEKALAQKLADDLQAANEKREQEEAMLTHLQNLVLTMKKKALKREEQFGEQKNESFSSVSEVQPEQEISPAPCQDKTQYTQFVKHKINRKLALEHRHIVSKTLS